MQNNARVTIGGENEDEIFAAHILRYRWNGWACPLFDKAEAQRVMDWSNKLADTHGSDAAARLHWEGDTLVLVEPWWGDDGTERIEPNENGFYGIGAMNWTWSIVGGDPFADDNHARSNI
jgi:hypothetical protein